MVGSFVFNPIGPGMIGVVSQTKTESTVALIDAVLQEMKTFSEQPVTGEELEAAKSALTNGNVFGFDSPFEIAKADATRDFYGYPADELSTFSRRIMAVSVKDVSDMAKKYYTPEGTKIAVVGDAAHFDGNLDRFGPVHKIPLEELDKN
jgi:zinc protease